MTRNPIVPTHIAIIMDGNRRWARKHGLPIVLGHRKAAYELIEPLSDTAVELGVKYLTLWAFSTENWKRDKKEVDDLLSLFRDTLSENIDKLHKKGARVFTIGDISKFPDDIKKKLHDGIEKTKNNTVITVTFALNYGGRDELLRAIQKLCLNSQSSIRQLCSGQKESSQLTQEELGKYLDTAGLPDPDLIIRTGGEKRLSGFLLWQCQYAELYFTDVLFPDFSSEEFKKAIADYQNRERRFGH